MLRSLVAVSLAAMLCTSCNGVTAAQASPKSFGVSVPAWECTFRTDSWCLAKTRAAFALERSDTSSRLTVSHPSRPKEDFDVIQIGGCTQSFEPNSRGEISHRVISTETGYKLIIEWDLVPGNCKIKLVFDSDHDGNVSIVMEEFATRSVAACSSLGCGDPTLWQEMNSNNHSVR